MTDLGDAWWCGPPGKWQLQMEFADAAHTIWIQFPLKQDVSVPPLFFSNKFVIFLKKYACVIRKFTNESYLQNSFCLFILMLRWKFAKIFSYQDVFEGQAMIALWHPATDPLNKSCFPFPIYSCLLLLSNPDSSLDLCSDHLLWRPIVPVSFYTKVRCQVHGMDL